MRFSVRHETIYRYSAPVRLGGHVLRLTPRGDGTVLHGHDLVIDPMPVIRVAEHDAFGNPVTRLDFAGSTELLRIESRFELETIAPTPGPRGAAAEVASLPWTADRRGAVAPFLEDGEGDATVAAFAAAVAADGGWSAVSFLDRLTRTLHQRTDLAIRPDGHAHTAAWTLANARGACRDVTVLFMAAVRSLGMPARFVSGYQARAETPDGRRHLHAWPEVLIPGVGWRGYDPTHGVAVGDGHVALAAAPDQRGTMPVEGGFWGDGVTSTLDHTVEIEAE